MKPPNPLIRGTIRRLFSNPRRWSWGAVLLSVLVCVSMAWLHLRQTQALAQEATTLEVIRQARIELAKGFLYASLAGDPTSPFQREQGVALLRQAMSTFDKTLAELGPKDQKASGALRDKIREFQGLLDEWGATRTVQPEKEVMLRVVFHGLELDADRIDSLARRDLKRLSAQLKIEFVVAMCVAALLLTGVCTVVFFAGRAKERSEARRLASEARYGITLRSIGDGVISTDIEARVELLNPLAEALTGWTSEEARGKPLHEVFRIINEETRRSVENPVERVLREGTVVGLANHTMLIARDGAERPIADSGAPIRNKEGAITGVVLVFRDQTEERAAQKALRRSEMINRNLVEHLPQRIFIKDRHSVYVSCNANYARDLGIGPEQIVGKDDFAFHPADLAEKYRADDRAVMASGTLKDLEERYLIDGEERFIHTVKVPYRDETGQVIGVLGIFEDVTDRKRAVEDLRASEEKFRLAFRTSPDSINLNRLSDGVYIDINEGFANILGFTREEVLGKSSLDLDIWVDPEDRKRLISRLKRDGFVENFEAAFRRKDGGIRIGLMSARVLRINQVDVILSITRDNTERKQAELRRAELEDQLLQARKIEAVGRLAGGVAHDFNNMLGVILGHTELALQQIEPQDPLYLDLREIQKAAHRSADLTRQLLGFARKQTINPRVLDLNDTVAGMINMLRRLIGENIDLAWMPGHALWSVNMDPSQIHQVLVNLAVNARDAIAGVGKVTIEAANVVLDGPYCAGRPDCFPGEYVLLAVSDNGSGMSKEVLQCIFEPFFTTKEVGQGTGLGLATVYGIARQNQGFVSVYSEVGRGTTFKIYLPRYRGQAAELPTEPKGAQLPRGTETVLIVEDEEAIMNLGRTILTRLGYTALTAGSPGEAIRLVEEHGGDLQLLITDMVMPEMNGRDLAERLRSMRPGLRCLFMSGYTANAIAHHGILDENIRFIQKPFSMRALAEKVREALDDPGS